jgi:hypothetical protein
MYFFSVEMYLPLSKMIKKNQDISLLTHVIINIPKETDLGTECKKHNITEEWLENPREINKKEDTFTQKRSTFCIIFGMLYLKVICKSASMTSNTHIQNDTCW